MAVAEHDHLLARLRVAGGPPPRQMVECLRVLRRRLVPFDAAWDAALERVSWRTHSARDEEMWREVLVETREDYRAAYERWEPLPRERAVGALRDLLYRLETLT